MLSFFTVALLLYASGFVQVHHTYAQATMTGNTSAGASFNRPDCDSAIPANCSASGTQTRFDEDFIVIGSSGTYKISSAQDYDGLILLYNTNAFFDETSPLTNVLASNDDNTSTRTSEINTFLPNSGGNIAAFYSLITTGFATNDFGNYTTTVTGPAGGLVLVTDGTNLSGDLTASTTNGPVWNRPNCPTANADPTSLSTCVVSTEAPRFSVHNFTPACEGPFFLMSTQDYDGFLMLYEGSFDVNNPLQNLVAYNDDFPLQNGNRASAFLVRLKANTKYFYVNTGFGSNAAGTFSQLIAGPQGCAVATAVEDAGEVPDAYDLSQVYPNPFNPQAQFTLTVGQAQRVTISVFDVLGRQVSTLHDGFLAPGSTHQFTFDAASLPSGLYLIRAQGETFVDTRQALLAK